MKIGEPAFIEQETAREALEAYREQIKGTAAEPLSDFNLLNAEEKMELMFHVTQALAKTVWHLFAMLDEAKAVDSVKQPRSTQQ